MFFLRLSDQKFMNLERHIRARIKATMHVFSHHGVTTMTTTNLFSAVDTLALLNGAPRAFSSPANTYKVLLFLRAAMVILAAITGFFFSSGDVFFETDLVDSVTATSFICFSIISFLSVWAALIPSIAYHRLRQRIFNRIGRGYHINHKINDSGAQSFIVKDSMYHNVLTIECTGTAIKKIDISPKLMPLSLRDSEIKKALGEEYIRNVVGINHPK